MSAPNNDDLQAARILLHMSQSGGMANQVYSQLASQPPNHGDKVTQGSERMTGGNAGNHDKNEEGKKIWAQAASNILEAGAESTEERSALAEARSRLKDIADRLSFEK